MSRSGSSFHSSSSRIAASYFDCAHRTAPISPNTRTRLFSGAVAACSVRRLFPNRTRNRSRLTRHCMTDKALALNHSRQSRQQIASGIRIEKIASCIDWSTVKASWCGSPGSCVEPKIASVPFRWATSGYSPTPADVRLPHRRTAECHRLE